MSARTSSTARTTLDAETLVALKALAGAAPALLALIDDNAPANVAAPATARPRKPRAPKATTKATSAKAAKASAPAPATDPRNREARQHNLDARLARRNDPANADNARGLTKREKQFLFHNFADYAAAVAWFKGLTPELQADAMTGDLWS